MSDDKQRFKVINKSDTGHCCFKYTIVDTENLDNFGYPDHVCELMNEKYVDFLIDLLNKK